jgi:proteasome lid subunit RPN8/RPN11
MKIPRSIVAAISAQAEAAAPIEACGYLAGRKDVVLKHYPMTNVDCSEQHFSFDPEEQFKVARLVREQKMQMIGVYHSHPATPARPSAEDIRLAYDPEIIHVILSLAGQRNDLKAFRISADRVSPETIEIT